MSGKNGVGAIGHTKSCGAPISRTSPQVKYPPHSKRVFFMGNLYARPRKNGGVKIG